MKIAFRKVSKDRSPFSLQIDSLEINGNFKKIKDNEVNLSLNIQGFIKHPCDICGEEFELECQESSTLLVSDGEYNGEELDVVESFDHYVNIDDIVKSEIESFKSDYHYCKKCQNKLKE